MKNDFYFSLLSSPLDATPLPPSWILVWHIQCAPLLLLLSSLARCRFYFIFLSVLSLLSCAHFGRKFIVAFVIIIPCHRYVTTGNRCTTTTQISFIFVLLIFFSLFFHTWAVSPMVSNGYESLCIWKEANNFPWEWPISSKFHERLNTWEM